MSRFNELSEALIKRQLEHNLREAGLSGKDAKTAVSVFSLFLNRGEVVKSSIFGKLFSQLKKRAHKSTGGPEGIRV